MTRSERICAKSADVVESVAEAVGKVASLVAGGLVAIPLFLVIWPFVVKSRRDHARQIAEARALFDARRSARP